MMKFSVLLSVYFKEKATYLQQCLESIFQQTLLPTEVVLVEDGPLTNELNEVIRVYEIKYPELKIISLSDNQGLGKALNEGLKHCSYDIVARMDSDDIAKPQRFRRQIQVFQEHPELDVVGAWVDEFQGDALNIISIRKLPENHKDICCFAKKRNPVNHPVVAFRKEAVLAAAGYQHFPFFEDYYLWVRMLQKGAKFYNIQESLLYFRFSPAMLQRRGGLKYAIYEYRFLRTMRKIEFISFYQFGKNVLVRFILRILPNSLRSILYKKILRR